MGSIELLDLLFRKLEQEAARRSETVACLVERILRFALSQPPHDVQAIRSALPVSSASGGVCPGVDINNSAALNDLLDEYT